jgi:[protein-PII] uridylyltransferase
MAGKASFCESFIFEAEALLVGSASHANRPLRVANAQKEFLDVLQMNMPDWSEAKCNKYIARHHDAYWLSYDIDTKIKHAALLSSVEDSGFQIEVTEDKKQDVLELNFTCPDHPGLFSRLSGCVCCRWIDDC